MQPRLELAHPFQPLHLYRHLLRETTYLPAICRPFVHGRIRAGFVRSQEAISKARRQVTPPTGLDDPRTKALHHGLRQLRGLRAVNLGDSKRLDRLLHHVFGRQGKRRRELIAPLLRPSPPQDSDELQKHMEERIAGPLLDKRGRALPMRRPDGWDKNKVLTYVNAQRSQQNATSPTVWMRIGTQMPYSPPRELERLPPTDNYGKPMNERRKRKAIERWWKSAATKMAPPVDKSEWEKLKAAVTGDLPDDWKFAPRRTIARSADPSAAPTPVEDSWDWSPLASRSASFIGRPVIRQQWRLTGKQETGPYESHRRQREALRARTLQRAYERISSTTPYLEQELETAGAKAVRWGGVHGLDANLPVATAHEARIFGSGEATKSTARVSYSILKFSKGDQDPSLAISSRARKAKASREVKALNRGLSGSKTQSASASAKQPQTTSSTKGSPTPYKRPGRDIPSKSSFKASFDASATTAAKRRKPPSQ